MEIRPIIAKELGETELAELTELRRALDEELAPGDPEPSPEWVRDGFHPGTEFVAWHHFAAFDGERPVALAELELVHLDTNLHLAESQVEVHPGHRRQGIGTALVAAVAEVARADSRTSLLGYGPAPGPVTEFWPQFGMEQAYRERISRLAVDDVDEGLMATWIDEAATTAEGYHLVRCEGALPDEWATALVVARNAMNDAPTDDLDIEDYHFDETWQGSIERLHDERRRRLLTILAIEEASGCVAGLTEISLEDHRRWHGWQGDTVVVGAHRGRRIGRWLKADMWRWVRELRPELRCISTYNAASNEHMLAINVGMGFRPHLEISCFQGPVP